MLGGFEVLVDSRPVPAQAWAQRRATDLVKLLALASGHRLSRDEVLEMLWPKLSTDAAAANLHKAASYARRALGDGGAIVLRERHGPTGPGCRGDHRRRAVRARRSRCLPGRPAPRRTVCRVDARTARGPARAPPRGDALPGPLGGGAPRGPCRRGGPPCADAPSRGEWRQAGRCAPVPAAARGAVAAGHRALGGDAGAPARAHPRSGGPRDATPPRARRRARARTRLGARRAAARRGIATGARC